MFTLIKNIASENVNCFTNVLSRGTHFKLHFQAKGVKKFELLLRTSQTIVLVLQISCFA